VSSTKLIPDLHLAGRKKLLDGLGAQLAILLPWPTKMIGFTD